MLDIMIKNGFLIDGTGAPWTKRDIGIKDGIIVFVGKSGDKDAKTVIDAYNMFVTPGFIDIHTHSDLGILLDPSAQCAVRQGVTTQVTGNCGDSAAPVNPRNRELLEKRLSYYTNGVSLDWTTFKDYLSLLEKTEIGINIAPLVGHNTVRIAVMGYLENFADAQQIILMKDLVREAMKSGSFGFSTGLVYPPGCFASTDEIVELASIASEYNGFYATHIRGEREMIAEAVCEAIEIGRISGCPVQISHNNPKFGGWGKSNEIQLLWEKGREEGVDITVDNDLHTDFAPALFHALPQWCKKLNWNELTGLLINKRDEIKKEIIEDKRPSFGPSGLLVHERFDRILIRLCPDKREYEGKSIKEIAIETKADPWDVFFNMIAQYENRVIGIFEYQDPKEVVSTVSHRLAMICSDGWIMPVSELSEMSFCNPCSFGEYPGLIERFVCNEKHFNIEEAIRKITSMPAARLNLQDRGIIREGFKADITVFDLPKVRDNATGVFPHRCPEGIVHVIINGGFAVLNSEFKGHRYGKVLKNKF